MVELKHNSMQDDQFYFGEWEFTNLIWALIRAYRFRNNNQNPKAIVMPNIKEVGGVRIEFPFMSIPMVGEKVAKAKRAAG